MQNLKFKMTLQFSTGLVLHVSYSHLFAKVYFSEFGDQQCQRLMLSLVIVHLLVDYYLDIHELYFPTLTIAPLVLTPFLNPKELDRYLYIWDSFSRLEITRTDSLLYTNIK